MLFTDARGANRQMLQQLQSWLPRILILSQWLFGLGIAYAIASTGLVLLGDGVATSEAPLEAYTSRQSTGQMPPAPSLTALVQRNLFGRSAADGAAKASTPSTPTRLPLTLKAVFVSTNPAQSTAIISQRGDAGKLYSVGDMVLGSARLAEIEATRVILRRAGMREELTFKSKFKAKESVQKTPLRQQASSKSPSSQPGDTDSSVIAQLNARLAQNPDETLRKMGVSQRREGGYRIGDTANQPLLAQTGLQPGDVVLSVNGRPLGDINVDRLALTNLATAGSVRVELLRNGQTLTITTRIPQSLR